MDQTYLVYSRTETDVEWLQDTMAPNQVLCVYEQLEDLLSLVDVTEANLVFVGMDPDNMVAQCGIIEGLLEARPFISVVGLGDGLDNQIIINAMRAGARDFIMYGMRSSEVQGLVRRLVQRLPALPNKKQEGKLTLIYGAQPDADAALVAAHLALRTQKRSGQVLLLDLGIPYGESLEGLRVNTAFYFGDALRNLRRLDTNLIESAFAQHSEGLKILAHNEEDGVLSAIHATELYLVLGVLRQHFKHIVVNLCGQPDSESLRTFISNSQRMFWYLDQSVSCCKRNLELLKEWQKKGIKLEHSRLIIDRYLPSVSPDADSVANSLKMPLAAKLPLSPVLRMNAKNMGRCLTDLAPRDGLSRGLTSLSNDLIHALAVPAPATESWWQRLRGHKS